MDSMTGAPAAGKSGCDCENDHDARHCPYQSLTQAVSVEVRSRFLTAERAAIAREQVAASPRVP